MMSDRHWIKGLAGRAAKAACAVAVIGSMAASLAVPAAAEGKAAPEADDRRYTITVDYSAESHTVPLTGSEFGLVRVMTEGNGEYEPVKGITVTPKQMYSDPPGAALQAEKDVTESGLAGKAQKVIPGADGKATADGLESGIYLVWQTKREGTSAKYVNASPVLVQLNEKTAVSVQPKTTVIPPAQPKKPETGDSTKVDAWVFAFMAASLLAAGLAIRFAIDRRQSKGGEENKCQKEEE